jgi:hypothetical protein
MNPQRKNLMKRALLLFVLVLLSSCEQIHYDGERRLVFQTIVKNSTGEPLPNTHVEISISSTYDVDLISIGKTNANGEITLLFPSPENDSVSINLRLYNDDLSYMEKEIWNIRKADFLNYKFVYPNTYLLKSDEVAPLNITYNQTDSNIVLQKVSIQGIYHLPLDYYHYPEGSYYLIPEQFLIKKNQSFQLKYTVKNYQTNIETEQTVDLQIDNDALNYTLNY